MIHLVIPGVPVSANKLYVPRKGGGRAKSAAYKTYRQLVAFYAKKAMREAGKREPLDGDCTVKLRFYFANPLADGDNAVKPTIDGLADGGVVANDRQFVNYVVQKRLDRARPRIEVSVWETGFDLEES